MKTVRISENYKGYNWDIGMSEELHQEMTQEKVSVQISVAWVGSPLKPRPGIDSRFDGEKFWIGFLYKVLHKISVGEKSFTLGPSLPTPLENIPA